MLIIIFFYNACIFFSDNLVLVEVGFKSLSFEMQEQQPAYDSISLFGKMFHLFLNYLSE